MLSNHKQPMARLNHRFSDAEGDLEVGVLHRSWGRRHQALSGAAEVAPMHGLDVVGAAVASTAIHRGSLNATNQDVHGKNSSVERSIAHGHDM
eukprot:CAMPEP_0204285188 /NCGR_PEP_ID=MMETSP0468-20130131/50081_1 /ASSEMBLY_ACC=CAM_ASM_000383 /TAXON_ID=2969 /ORGANISM="Oxyrrhis marina" /LENGTH=92 /DNA_ID=CAMNT_0051262999 /DNA_START=130 /DNA_END=408 /DNA_ORIENTATION=-